MRNRITAFICTSFLALAWSLSSSAQDNGNSKPSAKNESAAAAKKQSPPQGSAPKPFHVPQAEKFSLPNGLEVTLVPYGAIPKVTVALSIRAGNLNEAENQVWLAGVIRDSPQIGWTGTKSCIWARAASAFSPLLPTITSTWLAALLSDAVIIG